MVMWLRGCKKNTEKIVQYSNYFRKPAHLTAKQLLTIWIPNMFDIQVTPSIQICLYPRIKTFLFGTVSGFRFPNQEPENDEWSIQFV